MHTEKLENEGYFFRLVPDSMVERLVLGLIVQADLEKYRPNITFSSTEELTGHIEAATRSDEYGIVAATITVRRSRLDHDPEDRVALLFEQAPSKTIEIARLPLSLFAVVTDPEEPKEHATWYSIPPGEWSPSLHLPSTGDLYHGISLHTPNKASEKPES